MRTSLLKFKYDLSNSKCTYFLIAPRRFSVTNRFENWQSSRDCGKEENARFVPRRGDVYKNTDRLILFIQLVLNGLFSMIKTHLMILRC